MILFEGSHRVCSLRNSRVTCSMEITLGGMWTGFDSAATVSFMRGHSVRFDNKHDISTVALTCQLNHMEEPQTMVRV